MDKKDRLAQARSKLKSYQEKKISLDAHKDLNFALISDDAPQFADEARFSDMITENVHLNDTIRTLTSQMFEMHDKVAALEMEKQQLQLDVESPSEEIRLEMYLAKEETRNVKAQLFASEKQLGESQQLNQMQQRTNARLEASISHLEQLILEKGVQERELLISQSVPEHNTSDFEVQLADRDEQIKNLTNQLHHLQEHDITTKSKLEHLKKYLAEEDLQIQASSDREALARQDLKAATKQMNDMSQNLEIVQSQNIELQESFKKTQLEHEQTVNSLQTEIKAYSDSLKSSNKNVQNIESLMDLNSKYQSDLETLTSRNNHLLAENKQLILHLEELRQLTVTLTNEKANLVTEIRHVKNNSYMYDFFDLGSQMN